MIVTTPQEVSLLDVRKEIDFCHKVNLPILGVIENMSGFICPGCKFESNILPASTGGAEKLCTDNNIILLGKVPLDPTVGQVLLYCFIDMLYMSPVSPILHIVLTVNS